jgi:hypothetical protein
MFLPGGYQQSVGRCEICDVESRESSACWMCGRPMKATIPSTIINPHRNNPMADIPPAEPMEDWSTADWSALHLLTSMWSSCAPSSVDAAISDLYGESGLA